MPLFHYKAINSEGETVLGQYEAANSQEITQHLQSQGLLPIYINIQQHSLFNRLSISIKRKSLSHALLLQFTHQLAVLLQAGQPLDRALMIISDLPDDKYSQRIFNDIREGVRTGLSLSTALEQQRGVFSPLYINMIRAGEAGGSLSDTLFQLNDYLERSQQLQSRVINALIYPIILLVVVGFALLFLLGYVVPQFAQMYISLEVELPVLTKIILFLGKGVQDFWLGLIIIPCLFLWIIEKARHLPRYQLAWDSWILKQKLIGTLIIKLQTARFTHTLGTLLKNGVPVLSGLIIARNVLSNVQLKTVIDLATEAVKNGGNLSVAMAQAKYFPRLALQMLQVGEESGSLDSMLLKIATVYEHETRQLIDRLLSALVPVITLFLAGIIGLVIMAVLVPLYDLTNSIG